MIYAFMYELYESLLYNNVQFNATQKEAAAFRRFLTLRPVRRLFQVAMLFAAAESRPGLSYFQPGYSVIDIV